MIDKALSRRGFVAASAMAGAALLSPINFTNRQTSAATESWEQLESTDLRPVARWDHTLSADDNGVRLIVFGGRNADFVALADTWAYDFKDGRWTEIGGGAPESRFGHAVAVDSKEGILYLFGGQNAESFFNDTWQFDFAADEWTLLDSGQNLAPTPRYGLSGVFDNDGHFLISHGFTTDGRFDDTWSFDVNSKTWEDVSPLEGHPRPLRRCLHELAWSTETKQVILFGGCSSGYGPCPQGDLWSFDVANRAWTDLTSDSSPTARSNPALAWDQKAKQLRLIGGSTENGYASDLWVGTQNDGAVSWESAPIEAGPSPRASHDIAILGNDLYLYAGTSDSGILDDLWHLNLD